MQGASRVVLCVVRAFVVKAPSPDFAEKIIIWA